MQAKEDLKNRIGVAMGREPADLVFKNAHVICTFTEEIFLTDVAIANGRIVAINYTGDAKNTVDLEGAYLAPSFIDAHMHVESSMLSPEGFAEAVVPHGTGAIVSDPHEIVNVMGLKGFQYMKDASLGLPMDIFYTIPSCVPATHMETSGAVFNAKEIQKAKQIYPESPALSEMMNYPGVYFGVDEVLEKIIIAHEMGLVVDGHSPMLKGQMLNAYLNAGISTDHECTEAEEALEKIRKGMFVLIREGSAARNLEELIPIIKDGTAHRLCIASDDRHPDDLIQKGHLDYTLKLLLKNNVPLPRCVRLMTLNPALLYGLKGRGGIAPGYYADLVVFDSLEDLKIQEVYHHGNKVAEKGKLCQSIPRKNKKMASTVILPKNLGKILSSFPKYGKIHAIGIVPGELLTEKVIASAEDVQKGDIAYLAVIERHGKNGNVGLGFVKGIGLKQGAIASTVAHDSHNLIIAGKSLVDMEEAAKIIARISGGFSVVKNKEEIASLALPLGGIMSFQSAQEVSSQLLELEKAASSLGVSIHAPFMVLSFLALPVIPHIKLTDKGIVDVDCFSVIPLMIS